MSTSSTTPARRLSLADFRYELPRELIAQAPLAERGASRLLVLEGARREHRTMRELPDLLAPGDLLVLNDTRVVAARLHGRKASGGRVELVLERPLADGGALVRLGASKTPRIGARLLFGAAARALGDAVEDVGAAPADAAVAPASGAEGDADDALVLEVVARRDELFEVRGASAADSLADFLERHGEVPLPPYIARAPDATDVERYQTVYARAPGAVAAPTAGLHFDAALFDALAARGVERAFVTLHVGAGTFNPVRADEVDAHVMHAERLSVPAATVEAVAATRARGGRVLAVGTTSVRALESAAAPEGVTSGGPPRGDAAIGAVADGELRPFDGETRLFLVPGSPFRVVDALLTNFHLPESTLLMLVAAFAGLEETLAAYREAVALRYRFFSYGDAMLAWPRAGLRPARRALGGTSAPLGGAGPGGAPERRPGASGAEDGSDRGGERGTRRREDAR